MILNQTLTHGLFLVVFTGGQLFAGHVVFAFNFRRIKFDVVNAAGSCVNATPDDAVNDQFVRNIEFQHVIHGDTRFFHGVSLRNGAREAVQQKTVAAIFLSNTLFDQGDNQFVGDQLTGVHNIFRLFAQLGA